MKTNTNCYRGCRFTPEIISHGVWLCHRFSLSFRAVDQDGDVIDILVQRRRNARAAKRFFRKLLKERRTSAAISVPASIKAGPLS